MVHLRSKAAGPRRSDFLKTIRGRAWSGRLGAVLALLAAALCLTRTGRAQQASEGLPAEPILRIETGQHGAVINRIDTDAANHFAVTASQDKTVRVWSLPDGRLLRVLRLPLDLGNIGKAYAVAISPDGGTIAVGGWTGSPGHDNIFLFDRASGALTKRVMDLPDVIEHLAYSPGGQRLAASLGGSNGIRVFDAGHGYQPLPSDTRYKDSSIWATFARAGRLVNDVRRRVRPALRNRPVCCSDRPVQIEGSSTLRGGVLAGWRPCRGRV
jgi:WD40 repeat protein